MLQPGNEDLSSVVLGAIAPKCLEGALSRQQQQTKFIYPWCNHIVFIGFVQALLFLGFVPQV